MPPNIPVPTRFRKTCITQDGIQPCFHLINRRLRQKLCPVIGMVPKPVNVGAQDGPTGAERLDGDKAVCLPKRWHHEDVNVAICRERIIDMSPELNTRVVPGMRPQCLGLIAGSIDMQGDVVSPGFPESRDQGVEPLLPVKPTNRTDDPGRWPRGRQRLEWGQVHAGPDDRQPVIRAQTRTAQPCGLPLADGDDPVEQRERGFQKRMEPPQVGDIVMDERFGIAVFDMDKPCMPVRQFQSHEHGQGAPTDRQVRHDHIAAMPLQADLPTIHTDEPMIRDLRHIGGRGDVIQHTHDTTGRGVIDQVHDNRTLTHFACPGTR